MPMASSRSSVFWGVVGGALLVGLLTACGGPTSNLSGAGGGGPWSPTSPVLFWSTSARPEASPVLTTLPAQAATPDATITNLTDQIDLMLKDMENSNEDSTLQPLLPVQ
jgi:hypothetical protein